MRVIREVNKNDDGLWCSEGRQSALSVRRGRQSHGLCNFGIGLAGLFHQTLLDLPGQGRINLVIADRGDLLNSLGKGAILLVPLQFAGHRPLRRQGCYRPGHEGQVRQPTHGSHGFRKPEHDLPPSSATCFC
jgi:hypothetical protein